MLDESLRRICGRLDDSASVLDVGGWARPLNRADWVLDLMPCASRGMLGHDGEGAERFNPDTWVTRDVCAREPWPFADGSFDFAVCSHTLEDLRDPVWVCAELQRVARAGYIEVPSRLVEQSWNVQGPWVGWSHHHWLIDVDGAGISFVFKPHLLGGMPGSAFPAGFAAGLGAADRVQTLWWEGAFYSRERLFYEPDELNAYLTDFVRANLEDRPGSRQQDGLTPRGRRMLGRLRRAAARARSS